jgi:hypothetical protein
MSGHENPQNTPATASSKPKPGARAPVFLNPENPPDLIAKYRKDLGKGIEEILVSYKASGTVVVLVLGPSLRKEGEVEGTKVSPAEYSLRVKAKKISAVPTAEKLVEDEFTFVLKYERRLGKEFPAVKPVSYNETDIRRWILQQPFEDRKILMMNANQFRKHERLAGRETGEDEEEEA